MVDRSSYWIAGAVWIGSIVLVGAPTAALVAGSIDAMLRAAGVSSPPPLQLAIAVLAIALGLKVSTELARVRLHGLGELHRGSSTRTLVRHLVLAVPALFVVGYLGFLVVALLGESRDAGNPYVFALLLSTLLFFGLLVVSTARSFWAGRQDATARSLDDQPTE